MEILLSFTWKFMDNPEKTGEALHLFAQTPRKWELSLVYHFSFSLFFAGVPWQMTSGTKALALKN